MIQPATTQPEYPAPPPYPVPKQWEPEYIIAEVAQGLDELRVFYKDFGLKLPFLLFDLPWVTALLIPDCTLLRLSCLGEADAYTCTEKVYVYREKALPGRFPILWWLLAADIQTLQSRQTVHLWLTPEPESSAPSLEIDFDEEFLKLRVELGGEYEKIVQLQARVTDRTTRQDAPKTLYGKPVSSESCSKTLRNSGSVGEPESPSANAMIRLMFSHSQSKWRPAMTDCLRPFTKEEESVLIKFAQACKCKDDKFQHPMTAEQNRKCRELVDLSLEYAKEHLLSYVGKEGGPLCHKPYLAPIEKD